MNLLAIETSTPTLSVAIKKTGIRLRHATVRGYMKHAENLLPVIDRLLKKERLKIGDIDTFLISRGPGSFTGLRIGFATLKGFLTISPKPCYGALSLDVIAAGIRGAGKGESPVKSIRGTVPLSSQTPSNLAVCLDARRGKLYTRSYRYHKRRWTPNGAVRVILISEAASNFPEGTRIVGDGIAKLGPRALENAQEESGLPGARTLIELFEARSPLLKKLARPRDFLPVYLRHSEPEEKLREKSRKG